MSDHPVVRQRAELCDLLDSLSDEQWDAETLCDGWDSGDMVAHLLVREREPIPAIGILFPPLSGLHDARMAARKRAGRGTLMKTLRSGPPAWMKLPGLRDVQVGEDWIHMADIARGGAASTEGADLPHFDGTEDPDVAALLWGAVGRFAPVTLGSIDSEGAVCFTDGSTRRTYRTGGRFSRPDKGATPDVTVTAPVGELVLFVTGRRTAEVEITGDQSLVAALNDSSRGV